MKPKFDGYAAQYDAWFMENENVFQSEFRLFEKALGDISGKRVLSVGCGSGLFESMIDCSGIEGIEPSRDMGAIAQKRGVNISFYQSNHEGELVDAIQQAYYDGTDGIIFNPAAYTHTSIALLDALKAVGIPTVEVHISDVSAREDFRQRSFVRATCIATVMGKGFDGYCEAMDILLKGAQAE